MKRRLLTAAGALAILACGDIASPARNDVYEWRIDPESEEPLSFHWPPGAQPVRIWVDDQYNLPEHVRAAIDLWRGALLYQEWNAVIVDDSEVADVLVSGDEPPSESPFSRTRLESSASECAGVTLLDISDDRERLSAPLLVFVTPRFDPTSEATQRCMALTTAHEIGHSLGIFNHSNNPADLMYFDPVVETLSERDRETVEVLYHFPANLELVPR